MSPLAFWLARRRRQAHRHTYPHFECLGERDCDGLDEPGVGHVCSCSCRRCSIIVHENGRTIEVCICPHCDARECGLHRSLLTHS